MKIGHDTIIQTYRLLNTKSERLGNLWTWGDYDLSVVLITREAMRVWGQEVYGQEIHPLPPSSSCCKPKISAEGGGKRREGERETEGRGETLGVCASIIGHFIRPVKSPR